MVTSITAATTEGGGRLLASFGSGDSTGEGRLNRRARGSARNQNASAAEVRAVRSRINRMQGISQRRRRQLLREIDDNANTRGNIRRGILADIRAGLDEL